MRIMTLLLPTLLASAALTLALRNSDASADMHEASIIERFTGHYELVSFIQYPEGGGEVDANYEGRIMFDGFGNMSAQGMPRDLPERAAQTDELVRGGFAYYGNVSFDLDNNIIIHHVQGSPTRGSWVGEDNIRHFEFTDDYLKLSIKDENGRTTGTLTWRKLDHRVD